jgi:hypothetical protein
MTISDDLFRAILAMDSYNRGYNAAVIVNGSALGNASVGSNSTTLLLDANNQRVGRNSAAYSAILSFSLGGLQFRLTRLTNIIHRSPNSPLCPTWPAQSSGKIPARTSR